MSDTPITVLSENPQNEKLEALKNLFPEAFSEWKLNTTILAKTLGEESVSSEKEAYGMTWAGKSDARKQILTPTMKTLIPNESASVDYENTNNILIEWDNLEVLKLLQKGYSKQVKMIYIDPPYNTGKDFVYRDNFTSDKTEYEESTGQRDSDGNRLIQNTDTNGRYHSDWLSMMYPRLHLARNLLREDGVIFVSIDDHEVHNLRKIMDEIFGEENFVACVIWERAFSPINLKHHFSESHDYIICYAKGLEKLQKLSLTRSDDANDRYKNPDNDPRWAWTSSDFSVWPANPKNIYPITTPFGKVLLPPNGRSWVFSEERSKQMITENRVWFWDNGSGVPRLKRFLLDVKDGITPMTIWKYKEVWSSQDATKEVKDIFDGQSFFEYPKPVGLIKRTLELATSNNDLILDFFAWSGTTGHAVMALNAGEKAEAMKNGTNPDEVGNRRYICVQLPEETDTKSEAYKAGYKKISEITAERLRRAGKKIREENPDISLDTGFRLYRLDESCYQVASVEYRSEDTQGTLESLEKAIQSGLSPLREWAKEADVMVEILLKEGFPLTSLWDEMKIGENTFLHTENAGKQLYVSFEDMIAMTTIQTLGKEHSEAIFVVYDHALDDSRKVMLASRVKLRTI